MRGKGADKSKNGLYGSWAWQGLGLCVLAACVVAPGNQAPAPGPSTSPRPGASATAATAASATPSSASGPRLQINAPAKIKADQVRLELSAARVSGGNSAPLNAGQVRWELSSDALARLEDGRFLVPLAPGSLIVTGTSSDGLSARSQIEIEAVQHPPLPSPLHSLLSPQTPLPSSRASASPSASASSSLPDCSSSLPEPLIKITPADAASGGAASYSLQVVSLPPYPNVFFEPHGQLPTCPGLVPATRARLILKADNDEVLGEYCSTSGLKNRGALTFVLTSAQKATIRRVSVTIEDRSCGRVASSAPVPLSSD